MDIIFSVVGKMAALIAGIGTIPKTSRGCHGIEAGENQEEKEAVEAKGGVRGGVKRGAQAVEK